MSIHEQKRDIIGYCGYDKSEIYDGDDIVRYKGKIYHRENFVQMCLANNGEIIDPSAEE